MWSRIYSTFRWIFSPLTLIYSTLTSMSIWPKRKEIERPLHASTIAILNQYQPLTLHGNSETRDANAAEAFCQECNQLIQNLNSGIRGAIGIGDEREPAALEQGARNGCRACSMFQANLNSINEEWLKAFKGRIRIFLTIVPNFRLPYFLHPESQTPLKFVGYKEKEVSHLLNQGHVETNTGSDLSLSLAREWIRQCYTNHVSCRPAQGSVPYRPTRLLDVSGTSRTIRLCEKDEIPESVAYTTLSHSWGLHPPHRLTTKNIDSLKEGIDLDSLGKTFQDAVEVARRLAVSYIWIDCLCIIQDSAEDWAKESVVMQHVYGNSFCNIAATNSSDSRGGCFRDRNPNAIQPVQFDLGESFEQSSGSRIFYMTDINLWWERFEKSPLNLRAWVFQERLLSPRVLHFDEDQLAWECNELTACERFPWGTGELITSPKMRLPLEEIFRKALASGLKGSEIHDIWKPIVNNYSSTNLTKDSDRLIAIYGVAMKIKNLFGGEYAAGLFSRNMESQLLWHVIKNKTSYRLTERIAPSWSWASIAGAVNMLPQWDPINQDDLATNDSIKAQDLNEIAHCEVVNMNQLSLSSSSPMVSRDILELYCIIVPCFYVTSSETRSWKKCQYKLAPGMEVPREDRGMWERALSNPSSDVWPLAWEGEGWTRGEGTTMTHSIYDGSIYSRVLVSSIEGGEDSSFYIKLRYDVVSDFNTAHKRWLVPVYTVTEWEQEDLFTANPMRVVNGLVLEECGEGEARFRRLGVFKIEKGKDMKRFWDNCAAFEGPEVWEKVPVKMRRSVLGQASRVEEMTHYRLFLE